MEHTIEHLRTQKLADVPRHEFKAFHEKRERSLAALSFKAATLRPSTQRLVYGAVDRARTIMSQNPGAAELEAARVADDVIDTARLISPAASSESLEQRALARWCCDQNWCVTLGGDARLASRCLLRQLVLQQHSCWDVVSDASHCPLHFATPARTASPALSDHQYACMATLACSAGRSVAAAGRLAGSPTAELRPDAAHPRRRARVCAAQPQRPRRQRAVTRRHPPHPLRELL